LRSFSTDISYRHRGLSLLETMLAIFLLLTVLTFVLELYCRSFQNLTKVEQTFQATAFARDTLEEVRVWARDPVHFSQPTWAPFANVTDSRYPDFAIQTEVAAAELNAACTAFEDGLNAADRLTMPNSARTVTLSVIHRGVAIFELSSLIAEPERRLAAMNPVRVVANPVAPDPVAVDGEVEFQASLLDSAGAQITDVEFTWSVLPGPEVPTAGIRPGNGMIVRVSRDGTKAVFKNRYERTDGTVDHTGGVCRVVANAKYFAATQRGRSVDLRLAQ
jgi:Tfp pilus assembly protein PilV